MSPKVSSKCQDCLVKTATILCYPQFRACSVLAAGGYERICILSEAKTFWWRGVKNSSKEANISPRTTSRSDGNNINVIQSLMTPPTNCLGHLENGLSSVEVSASVCPVLCQQWSILRPFICGGCFLSTGLGSLKMVPKTATGSEIMLVYSL